MMMSEVALAHSGPDLFQACRFPRRSPFQSCRVATLSELSRGDLEALTERLLAENAALKQVVADLRAGIVRLKGVTGVPRSDRVAWSRRPSRSRRTRPASVAPNSAKLVIDEERVIKVDGVALQGLRGLHRPGSGAAPACRAHPPGALARPTGRPSSRRFQG